jgi:hypothetical protein
MNAQHIDPEGPAIGPASLPASFEAGAIVTPQLFAEVHSLLSRQQDALQSMSQREQRLSQRFKALEKHLHSTLAQCRVAVQGWGRQRGVLGGYYPDGWVGPVFSGTFVATRALRSLTVGFYVPAHAQLPMKIVVDAHRASSEKVIDSPGEHSIELHMEAQIAEQLIISVRSSTAVSGQAAGVNSDVRELSILLHEMMFE